MYDIGAVAENLSPPMHSVYIFRDELLDGFLTPVLTYLNLDVMSSRVVPFKENTGILEQCFRTAVHIGKSVCNVTFTVADSLAHATATPRRFDYDLC